MNADLQALARALARPAAELGYLSRLDAGARAKLLADVERARALHGQHLRGAMENALGHIPWLLRAPMRRLFGL
jgi:hypothetical protein